MDFSLKAVLVAMVALLAVAYCADSESSKVVNKRDSENTEHQLQLDDDLTDELEKRRIFRYGRGVFRYGKRAPVFRYGKRGSAFRYGKRDDDADDVLAGLYDDDDVTKRIFRYGKRDGDDSPLKRLFRYGKRDESDASAGSDIDEEKRIFRYGKRDDDEDWAAIKRVFRFGKRGDGDDLTWDDLTEEQKRQIFRYGRDIRAPQSPHVPFRFGERE